jgi:protein TonB
MVGLMNWFRTALRRYRPSQTVAVVLCVLMLHMVGIWALQSGLLMRAVEAVIAVEIISDLVELPKPKVEKAPPSTPRVMQKTVPVPTQHEVARAAQPVLLAIADTSPSPNAATGVLAPQSALPPIAAPVSASPAPVANPKVDLPSSDAEYLHNPKPEYPRISKQRAEQGKVVVNVYIGTDGIAQKVEIKTSSGYERLDQAALTTARAWRYIPGKRGGVPEAMWFSVPINFVLE